MVRNSIRVDERIKCCTLFAIGTKARTVVGMGDKNVLGSPGLELGLASAKEKEKVRQ